MNISWHELSERLKKQIDSRYLIYGKEPFLVQRCADAIRAAAKQQGYLLRIPLIAEYDFDWGMLTEHTASMGLFGEKKIVEVRLPTGRAGVKGADALMECLQTQDQGTIVTVVIDNPDADVKSPKWIAQWRKSAVTVNNALLFPNQFLDWIRKSLDSRNIQCEQGVYRRLAYYFEGNMTAAANEIGKISMGNDGSLLTVADVERIVVDQGRFNVFALVDACSAGRADRALRLLKSLHNEGVEPVLVLWALTREVRTLYKCAVLAQKEGRLSKNIFDKLNIWRSRQDLVSAAVRRLQLRGCAQILHRVAQADRIMKGREPDVAVGTIWEEFEKIALMMCSIRPLTDK